MKAILLKNPAPVDDHPFMFQDRPAVFREAALRFDGRLGLIGGAIPKGLFWITRGLLELPFSFPFGFHHAVKRLQWIAFGLGRITGLAGYKYPEYQTTDGA